MFERPSIFQLLGEFLAQDKEFIFEHVTLQSLEMVSESI